MEIVTNFLTNSPWIQLFCARIPIFICVILYLAFAGVGAMLIAGRTLAKKRKRTSYDKCALQIGYIALFLGMPLAVGLKIYLYHENGSLYPTNLQGYFFEALWFTMALIVLYNFLYVCIWKLINKKTWLQNIFGSICLLQGIISTIIILFISKMLHHPEIDLANQATTNFLLTLIPQPLSPNFQALVCLIPLFFAIPAVIGNIGLLLLRNINDYGRDHYNIAIAWCTNWVKKFGILLCLAILTIAGINIWQAFEAQTLDYLSYLDETIFLGLWLIVTLTMGLIGHSQIPLRHKFSMLFADILAIASIYFCLDWWLT